MTYTPKLSKAFGKLVTKFYNNIKIGYKSDSTMNKIKQHTYEKIRTENQHGVVYAFNCKNCEGEYIGQTGQNLKIRIN